MKLGNLSAKPHKCAKIGHWLKMNVLFSDNHPNSRDMVLWNCVDTFPAHLTLISAICMAAGTHWPPRGTALTKLWWGRGFINQSSFIRFLIFGWWVQRKRSWGQQLILENKHCVGNGWKSYYNFIAPSFARQQVWSSADCHSICLGAGEHFELELETMVHTKVCNHGEGPTWLKAPISTLS